MQSTIINNLDRASFSKVNIIDQDDQVTIPFVSQKVPAGSPCPSDSYIEETINLNKVLITKPKATFCIRVVGDSMIEAGIKENDILVVDSSMEPSHNKIVVAAVDGDLTVKRLCRDQGQVLLCPENANYTAINVTDRDLNIWGVVTFVIHQTL